MIDNSLLKGINTLDDLIELCNQIKYKEGDPLVVPLLILSKGMADIVNEGGSVENLQKYAGWVYDLNLLDICYEV